MVKGAPLSSPPTDPVELLGRLTEAAGPSGHEQEVRAIVRAEAARTGADVRVDRMGNVIARKGRPGAAKVMLAAHMDEVALLVVAVEKNGLLRFRPVGGVDPRLLVAKTVVVGDARVPGVIGAKPVHLQERDEQEKPISLDQLYIDVGAGSREEAERVVHAGDYAVFTTRFARLGAGLLKGKALDDRAGCTVLLGALAADYDDVDVHAVFTVQEEVGTRGATVAAYDIGPDWGMALEGTICSDTPGSEAHAEATRLGAGPAISIMDATSIPDRGMVRTLVRLADQHGLPHQYRRTTAGGNDAGRIQLTHAGVPSCSLSVPCRYIHSPVSLASASDLAATTSLLVLFLNEIARGGLRS